MDNILTEIRQTVTNEINSVRGNS